MITYYPAQADLTRIPAVTRRDLSPGRGGRAHLKRVEQARGRRGDLRDGLVEGGRVARRGRAEAADLPHVLQGRGPHVVICHDFGVGRAQGLNRTTHAPSLRRPWGAGGRAGQGGTA